MRTTLTLDRDVAAVIERLRKTRRQTLKGIVNEAVILVGRLWIADRRGRRQRRRSGG